MSNYFPSESEAKQQAIDRANRLLANVGTNLQELGNKRRVLDLGAGQGELQEGALVLGFNNVISFDLRARQTGMGAMGNARELPLSDNSIDLIICRAGPIPMASSEQNAKLAIAESNRALTADGEIRVYPAFFRFIYDQVWKKNLPDDTHQEPKNDLIAKVAKEHQQEINQHSAAFLESLGYKDFIKKNQAGEDYWQLPKL